MSNEKTVIHLKIWGKAKPTTTYYVDENNYSHHVVDENNYSHHVVDVSDYSHTTWWMKVTIPTPI